MTTIAIIYRDNELFASYVPKVVDYLRGEGHEVQTKVFPKGTPEESIANDVPAVGLVVTDETFCRATGYKNPIGSTVANLDYYFRYATQMAFASRGGAHGIEVKKILNQLVAEALSNGAEEPHEIVVARRNLCDHDHQWTSEEEAGNAVACWFREIFPAVEVRVTDFGDVPSSNQWLVGDRHNLSDQMVKDWRIEHDKLGMVLRLPLETAAKDLGTLGLVQKDETVFDNELRQCFLQALELATGAA